MARRPKVKTRGTWPREFASDPMYPFKDASLPSETSSTGVADTASVAPKRVRRGSWGSLKVRYGGRREEEQEQ